MSVSFQLVRVFASSMLLMLHSMNLVKGICFFDALDHVRILNMGRIFEYVRTLPLAEYSNPNIFENWRPPECSTIRLFEYFFQNQYSVIAVVDTDGGG